MSKCPSCRKSFRTMDDEVGMHDCPYCGYFPEPEPTCDWCNGVIPYYDDSSGIRDYRDYPYCSSFCSAQAERDSGVVIEGAAK